MNCKSWACGILARRMPSMSFATNHFVLHFASSSEAVLCTSVKNKSTTTIPVARKVKFFLFLARIDCVVSSFAVFLPIFTLFSQAPNESVDFFRSYFFSIRFRGLICCNLLCWVVKRRGIGCSWWWSSWCFWSN